MSINARYVHTNIVARDWKALALFYESVLGCERVLPERDLAGPWVEDATGVPGAHIRGIHLKLPGYGPTGPTLEIFQYDEVAASSSAAAVNSQGLAHLAFAVEDVDLAYEAILGAGGKAVGKVVSLDVPGAGTVTLVYVTDPEGNIIELQRWS